MNSTTLKTRGTGIAPNFIRGAPKRKSPGEPGLECVFASSFSVPPLPECSRKGFQEGVMAEPVGLQNVVAALLAFHHVAHQCPHAFQRCRDCAQQIASAGCVSIGGSAGCGICTGSTAGGGGELAGLDCCEDRIGLGLSRYGGQIHGHADPLSVLTTVRLPARSPITRLRP